MHTGPAAANGHVRAQPVRLLPTAAALRTLARWLTLPRLHRPPLPQAARVGEDCEGYRPTSYYETQRRSLDGFMSEPVQVRADEAGNSTAQQI